MSTHDDIEQQRTEKRATGIAAGEITPTAAEQQRVLDAQARHAGQTDPTTSMKLDRLLARNALTSLGRDHPANMSRAERRARGWRGALPDVAADLKRQAHEADQ